MLYILTGSDFPKVKKRALEIAKGHELVRFGEGNLPFADAPGHVGASGLFSKKTALYLDRPMEDEKGAEMFLAHLGTFSNSDTPVIAITDVDAALKKKLPSEARIESFEEEQDEEIAPNVFALADAFAKGDRKRSWVLYRRMIEYGAAPEEIHGTLSWQARALVLASKTDSATELGLKPFAYTKAKSALSKMKTPPEELSRELVTLYHKSRMGEGSLEDLLETFLLKK